MKNGMILVLLLTVIIPCVRAQQDTTSITRFETFAEKESAFIFKACENVDTVAYQEGLREFLAQYKILPDQEKSKYAGYLQNIYYNGSCCYSLAHLAKQSITLLREAVAAGYNNYQQLMADKDLYNIRNGSGFQNIVNKLRKTGDYLYILKKHHQYNVHEKTCLPEFKYQNSQDVRLQELRKAFNLDSIAGEGSEYLKLINLMHWVHTLIPHDGNHANPETKNALSMVVICKKDSRGLNCRGLATVLNECYLAMGYKSRMVTCLPKDSLKNDPDCHVINAVYSGSLKKWLWMDPTNDAYVMDENGVLLSIEEVRARIITNKPLILNPSANWNNRVSKTKKEYLCQYMAKNLYKLQCAINSEYNAETVENGKNLTYITLVPQNNYDSQFNTNKQDTGIQISYTFYETSNPAYFWKSPEMK